MRPFFCYKPLAPEGHRWTHFTTKTDSGLGDDNIFSMAVDGRNRVWIGQRDHGFSVGIGDGFRNYGITDGPLGEHVSAIAISPVDGDAWCATSCGICRYSQRSDQFSYYTIASGLPANQISAIAITSSGTVIAGTPCDGIALASPADGYRTWRKVSAEVGPSRSPGGPGLPCAQVNCLFVSRATGTIYVGTMFGLGRSEDGGKTFSYLRGAEWERRLKGEFGSPAARPFDTHGHFLPGDDISALGEDSSGRLYVAARKAGVDVIDPRDGKSIEHIQADFVSAVLPVPGGMLLAQYGGGVAFHPTCEEKTIAPRPLGVAALASPASFPRPAAAPTEAELRTLAARVTALPAAGPGPWASYLGDDFASRGDWLSRYGTRYLALFAAHAPLDHIIASDLSYHVSIRLGPNAPAGDHVRRWLH